MTYCVGMCLEDGLVLASDSRTNAGVDYVTSYSKMYVFTPAPDRIFVLLSAGNLATTQEIINLIQRDIDYPDNGPSLLTARYLFEAADYIGKLSLSVQKTHEQALNTAGVSGEVSLILGGQIQGQKHSLMLIYPQGNHIEASTNTPYLQIGETKYGKPVLDRVIHHKVKLEDAARLALVSLNSAANSNITVGPPFELAVYRTNNFQINSRCRFEENGAYLTSMEKSWRQGLQQAFDNLPRFEWEVPQNTNSSGQAESQLTTQMQTQAQQAQQQIQQISDTNQPPVVPCGIDGQTRG